MAATKVSIPDNLRNWPWPRELNPNYEEVAAESRQWTENFKAFSPKAQKAFDRCNFSLLAMLAYPRHDRARARTGCDLMNLFYVFDEYTDVEDEHVTRHMADIVMDAIRNPSKPRPQGECILGEVARQYWQLAIQTATPTSQKHFIETFDEYVYAVVQQAEDRCRNRVRNIDSYLEVRREASGCKPSFAIIELEMDLPDEVYHHPDVENLRIWAMDMICIGNDIHSYPIERARGHAIHNMVTTVMHQMHLSVQDAVSHIGKMHDSLAADFLSTMNKLPSWGAPLDQQVMKYIGGLAIWVRANDAWTFESQRYFGTAGAEIQRLRVLEMLPKVNILQANQVAVDSLDHHIAGLEIAKERLQTQSIHIIPSYDSQFSVSTRKQVEVL